MKLSVILCTHNPRADYLRRTLDALESQTLGRGDWELLVIDNRSDQPLAGRIDLSWHADGRIVREDKLGLTPARLRGMAEAKGDLLVFVDDDNVLDPDYLAVALAVAQSRPFLGSWSGQCRPGFEAPPPEWTRRYWGNLALREFDADIWSNLPRLSDTMPCGAGLCVRRPVAEYYRHLHDSGQRAFQFDRTGSSLISGGDNDLAACACDIGLGVGLVSTLGLTHLIPAQRLNADYLARLAEGIFFSAVILAHLRRSDAELARYQVRWHEPLRAALNPAPHRSIQFAALRGRRRGLEYLAALAGGAAAGPDHA